jgi:hypothetical protein
MISGEFPPVKRIKKEFLTAPYLPDNNSSECAKAQLLTQNIPLTSAKPLMAAIALAYQLIDAILERTAFL